MDLKIGNQKHSSTSIPYVRTRETSSDGTKPHRGHNFIFEYKTSFIAVLFSTLIVGCFIMIMIYVNIQSDRYTKSSQTEEEFPFSSSISFDIDPDTKTAFIEMASDKDIFIPNIPYLQNELASETRQKRQISVNNKNSADCKSQQKECQAVLKAVHEITESMSNRLEHLKNQLIQQNILSENDPQDVNYQKIFDCLQCGNTINHDQEDEIVEALPGFDRQSDAHISEVLPYFDNQHFADEDDQEKSESQEEKDKGDDRTERGLTKQVMESVTNNSKVSSGAKITEIIHNTTIVEKEQDGLRNFNENKGQAFHHRPVDMSNIGTRGGGGGGGESQVTRNMDSATPIILPTAETTKTSQQIQFTPQGNWPMIPVCFYNPSSGSPQQQQQQQQQLSFPPQYSLPQGIPGMNPGMPGQQVKFFSANGQPIFPPNFQSPMSAQFQSSSPQFPQSPFQTLNQSPQRNAPYYCTYIQAPNVPQQAFPQVPVVNTFQNSFVSRGFERQSSMNDKMSEKGKQLDGAAKSTYDDSDEKYWVDDCQGFFCNPPYKKCIAHHQRCDGRVDCMGAEDEIGCPIEEDSYYSRFVVDRPSEAIADQSTNSTKVVEKITQTITTYMATTNNPIMDTTEGNDVEATTITIMIPEIPSHFQCKRIIQTVTQDKRCDGVFDCEDASDEEDCTCKDYLKRQRPFAVCDGHVDCSDGSDEEGCNFCRKDEYHCHRSGGCIPKQQFCNQHNDCKLNEDELDCFVLTDGKRVNLDLDKRPHLNLAGVLTRYERGAWRPSCFKSEYRSEAKRMTAGHKICEYLGFRNVDTVNEVIVQKSKLEERSATSQFPIGYEYPPQFSALPRGDNNTCYGLYIRCKPILDRKVNVHLKIDPSSQDRSYIWPWEGSVFVDGKYHCPAVLLEKDLLLASSKCSEDIDLRKNYTTAVFGVSSPDVPYSGPYQQTSQIVDIRPIKNSEASLFRLKDDVNMTRYVQPIYLERRIFPAAKNDSCVALGVNERHERKMKFLQPIIDNCPKCHRCYLDRNDLSSCSKVNETSNWSGNIVCLSGNGGWYPTAVFQDKDENCGFSNKQILNSIDYIHAHLSEAIDERDPILSEPACEGVRCAFGECVPWDRVCDGVRDCKDGADEIHDTCTKIDKRCEENNLECKCSKAELRCGSGKCVAKEKFCDGKVDCDDGSDEPATCTCAAYLKLTRPKLVCDNRRHCLDKSDEDYRNCHCKDNSFKCNKSTINGTTPCIPPDFVCDGHEDCPSGEDESDATCLTIKSGRFEPHGKGELLKKSYGVWHALCLPEPVKTQSEVQASCIKLGYRTGLLIDGSQSAEAVYVPRNDFYMFQPNSHTWVTTREDVSFGTWIKPNMPCYRLNVHCF